MRRDNKFMQYLKASERFMRLYSSTEFSDHTSWHLVIKHTKVRCALGHLLALLLEKRVISNDE
jgi:hypothetical protein